MVQHLHDLANIVTNKEFVVVMAGRMNADYIYTVLCNEV